MGSRWCPGSKSSRGSSSWSPRRLLVVVVVLVIEVVGVVLTVVSFLLVVGLFSLSIFAGIARVFIRTLYSFFSDYLLD